MKNIQDMPVDILILIFEHLHLTDILEASLVNKYWNEVITDVLSMKRFQKQIKVNMSRLPLFKIVLDDTMGPAINFINSDRKYYHLQVKTKFNFIDCSRFFTKLGETIQILQLGIHADVSGEVLLQILTLIKNPLKELDVKFTVDDEEIFMEQFDNFCATYTVISKLEQLDIECKHNDDVSTRTIIKLMAMNCATLKSLILHGDYEDQDFLRVFQTLTLEKFVIDATDIEVRWFHTLFALLPHCKDLRLAKFNREEVEENDYDYISNLFPQLRKLEISIWEYDYPEEYTVFYLSKLKHIDSYNLLFDPKEYRAEYVVAALGKEVNPNIKKLRIEISKFSPDLLCNFLRCFPNLVDLTICDLDLLSDIGDDLIQCVIANLRNIRYLVLNKLKRITDYGLTGIVRQTGQKNGYSLSELVRLDKLEISLCENLTDFTLMHAIQFKELRRIYLNGNNHYTVHGFKRLVANCPSLEKIHCDNQLSWDYMNVIKTIKRLKLFAKACTICKWGDCKRWLKTYSPINVFEPFCEECGFNKFVRNVSEIPTFMDLDNDTLYKIFSSMKLTSYEYNQYIVQDGQHCDKFFYIIRGQVKLTKRVPNRSEEISFLERYNYFNERALIGQTLQTKNVIVNTIDTLCFVIDFKTLNEKRKSDCDC